MGNLSNIGRVFYGIAMEGLGFLMIFFADFPYMLIPPKHAWLNGHGIAAYLCGILLALAGICIVGKKKTMPATLLLGTALLLIFCFYFIPYELLVSPNSMHFAAWENAAKELALAAGAFVIAGSFTSKTERPLIGALKKLIPLGTPLFALTILSFGANHFLYARDAADYIPSWIPGHLFWIYLAGAGLLAAGIAILLNVMRGLAAFLLGVMIFIWVIILHIPKAIAFPADNMTGEVSSGLIALAYCGIAFVIAGGARRNQVPQTGG